jgi:hypothetical protein
VAPRAVSLSSNCTLVVGMDEAVLWRIDSFAISLIFNSFFPHFPFDMLVETVQAGPSVGSV